MFQSSRAISSLKGGCAEVVRKDVVSPMLSNASFDRSAEWEAGTEGSAFVSSCKDVSSGIDRCGGDSRVQAICVSAFDAK